MNINRLFLILLLLVILYALFTRDAHKYRTRHKNKGNRKNNYEPKQEVQTTPAQAQTQNINFKNYKSKWIFTQNEKTAYWAIKEVTDELGLILLAKVRLFDLVEPKKGMHIVYQHKIQAKHVDFVVCDSKLVARVIIELDDSSHDRSDRMERDAFVDEVLWNTGYTIIRARGINKTQLREILQKYSAKQPATE